VFNSNFTIKVHDKLVEVNSEFLSFNENNLNQYFMKEATIYSYYASMLVLSQNELDKAELEYDIKYSQLFSEAKENESKISDKKAESMAKSNVEVLSLHNEVLNKKRNVDLLKYYLRAWDKSHENAQALGHMIRKEMDKLNHTIPKEDDNIEDILLNI
jgi:hypothetical protein